MVQLKILGITFSQVQAGAYALILTEENGKRRIPIIIGTPEAQSIAIFLEGLTPPRPLTHDLFITFAQALNAELKQVNIYKYEDGVFYSEILFTKDNKNIYIDARTSDAIALAIRNYAPIYITEAIMNDVSILMTDDDFLEEIPQQSEKKAVSFESMTPEELQQSLNDAITSENYEQASHIRDIIKKKSGD
ncbi:hypothetical protein AGMMS50262_06290 [Bacteroidia bacterium]|nr:hypothetical protein AGMMS50262_06290 [Bacteroidia bacterium]